MTSLAAMQRSRRSSSTRFGASWRPWSLRSKNMASRSPHPSSVCPRIGAALGPTDTSRSSSSSACSCARACDGPTGGRSMTRRPWARRPDQRVRMEPLARRLEGGVGDGGARGDSRPETRPYAAGDHRSFARARALRQIISVTGLRQSDVSSKSFKLAGGSYTLDFTATAPGSGCTLDLFLATKANGPSIEGAASVFPSGRAPRQELSNGRAFLLGPTSLRRTTSGITSCKGVWSATLTRQS